MAVRVIFRGLILFEIPETGSNAGKLVAYLINHPTFAGGSKAHGHPHDHNTEIQILTGEERGTDLLPTDLVRGATLDIIVRGPKGVSPSLSYDQHVPDLGVVIAKGTPAIRNAGKGPLNPDFIQNVVTVDRGIVRAKEVTLWDQGGYPLSGNADEVGERAASPAVVKFMGSSVRGHTATEVVVEIADTEEVELKSDHDRRFNGPKRGSANPSDPHVPAETVEILITSYERPTDKPTPWGLDFQWLFEAAGYRAADLAGPEFTTWVEAGQAYDRDLFDAERRLFFGPQGTVGRPFPYVESATSLTPLQPLTNYPNIFVCLSAKMTSAEPVTAARTTVAEGAITETATIETGTPAAARKSAMRKAAVKKAAVKKAAVKKAAVKKVGTKKTGAKKKTVAKKKTAAKKTGAKKKRR